MATPNLAELPDNASAAVISTTTVDKCDVMIRYLHQRQRQKVWSEGSPAEGIILKRAKNDFVCQPPELAMQLHGFFDEIRKLNVKVAMTVKTAAIQTFLQVSSLPYVPLRNGIQIQVLPNIGGLSHCKIHHYAAFIRDPGMLVVWDDDPSDIINRTEQIELCLLHMLWSFDDSRDKLDAKLDFSEKTTELVSGDSSQVNIDTKDVSDNTSTEEAQP